MDAAIETQPPGGATGAGGEGRDMDDREVQGDEQLISQLPRSARAQGLTLTGHNGLLARLTKAVIEGVLEGEMEGQLERQVEHVYADPHALGGGGAGAGGSGRSPASDP